MLVGVEATCTEVRPELPCSFVVAHAPAPDVQHEVLILIKWREDHPIRVTLYAYVGGDPIGAMDPWGLSASSISFNIQIGLERHDGLGPWV